MLLSTHQLHMFHPFSPHTNCLVGRILVHMCVCILMWFDVSSLGRICTLKGGIKITERNNLP